MIMTRLVRTLRRRDSGYALVAVIGLGLIMLTMISSALVVASSGQRKADSDADWNAALTAAYAGLDDYKARLAGDNRYIRYGNSASAFDGPGGSLTMPTGEDDNPAFDLTAAGRWAEVPGSSADAFFRYEIDDRNYYTAGTVSIRSTGKVGNSTRSVIAEFRQRGFFDYVYFTNYEVQDPAISGEDPACENYAWVRPAACREIFFGGSDNLRGDVHSNDRLEIACARFFQEVTSAARAPIWNDSGCALFNDAQRFQGGRPTAVPVVPIPPTNDEQALETRIDLPDLVPEPGCLYTGPTSITYLSDGTMRVVSPWTRKTHESYTAGIASLVFPDAGARNCGRIGTGVGQLGHAQGAIVPVPENNIVYVQGVDPVSGNPNHWAPGTFPTNFVCSNEGAATEGWSFASGAIRYPARIGSNNEGTPLSSTSVNPAYSCRGGDAYVSGQVDGRTTLASSRYIYITGDLTYTAAATSDDVLGLVAQKAVWVWNPMRNVVNNTGVNNDSGTAMLGQNRTINAAILSVSGTFQLQNYHVGGTRGTLNITGSIAQKFRGTVATTSNNVVNNGYVKNYAYDEGLRFIKPPKFLAPTSIRYDVSQMAGVPAAFDWTGAPTS